MQIQGLFWFYAVICLGMGVHHIFYLKESKGLALEELMTLYNNQTTKTGIQRQISIRKQKTWELQRKLSIKLQK